MVQSLRQKAEKREVQMLAPQAVLSINTRGRQIEELPCPIRTSFNATVTEFSTLNLFVG